MDIVLRQRGIAERMIESFMLVANETVAEHFAKLNLPFIYRIHEEPKAEKVQKFIDYASSFGIRIYGTASSMSQQALQDIYGGGQRPALRRCPVYDASALHAAGSLL